MDRHWCDNIGDEVYLADEVDNRIRMLERELQEEKVFTTSYRSHLKELEANQIPDYGLAVDNDYLRGRIAELEAQNKFLVDELAKARKWNTKYSIPQEDSE